ncbi:response regulator transcription factor [Aliirhizobium smilacinae]|uniref:Response regulator transcription factor n=1 Tax=Aliirhizobium smilacinae TaxID=1395944 RepID=A0A5C4XC56_9HYPH|nr:response regulator [Rhizobium smilacinae]TNM60997.1 response regulator transcription factor [Rhizobium smilacinae]
MSDVTAPIIYLIDDDEAILKALRRLLETYGHHVDPYSSAESFLENHDPEAHGCAVVDLGLPGMDGLAVQELLVAESVERPIIFLTGKGDIPASVRAMKAGAVDFLTKPVNAECLLAAVDAALKRDANMRQEASVRHKIEQRMASLTAREREVLGCVVAGRLNKQIAAELGTVEKTIKVHRGRMMEKMGVRTVADLVRLSVATHH